MRTWLRSPIEQVCGNCTARIHRGDPVQILRSPENHPWRKARCVACAVGTAPELPALEEPQREIVAQRKPPKLARVGDLAADFKLKQAGE